MVIISSDLFVLLIFFISWVACLHTFPYLPCTVLHYAILKLCKLNRSLYCCIISQIFTWSNKKLFKNGKYLKSILFSPRKYVGMGAAKNAGCGWFMFTLFFLSLSLFSIWVFSRTCLFDTVQESLIAYVRIATQSRLGCFAYYSKRRLLEGNE